VHEDGEVSERLAGAADLGLPEWLGGVGQGGEDCGGDGEVLAALADEVEAVSDNVAEVERLDGAVEDVGDKAVERGASGGGGGGGCPGEAARDGRRKEKETRKSRRRRG
jgi:hypothetical protein